MGGFADFWNAEAIRYLPQCAPALKDLHLFLRTGWRWDPHLKRPSILSTSFHSLSRVIGNLSLHIQHLQHLNLEKVIDAKQYFQALAAGRPTLLDPSLSCPYLQDLQVTSLFDDSDPDAEEDIFLSIAYSLKNFPHIETLSVGLTPTSRHGIIDNDADWGSVSPRGFEINLHRDPAGPTWSRCCAGYRTGQPLLLIRRHRPNPYSIEQWRDVSHRKWGGTLAVYLPERKSGLCMMSTWLPYDELIRMQQAEEAEEAEEGTV